MRHREAVLSPHGYQVEYVNRPAYRGRVETCICTATKDGVSYYPIRDPGHYQRIQSIQDSIPHMARIANRVEDVVLFETARGTLLWEIDCPPDPAKIENQLMEFARGTQANDLLHADLRPWNVFVDDAGDVQVIDWNFSTFIDELRLGDNVLSGHLTLTQRGRRIVDLAGIDVDDAKRIGCLLRGEIRFGEAWPQTQNWFPPWCRH